MTKCNNCGHIQEDVLSSADIEAIQFQSLLLEGRCESMESENSSLRTMLKTQSEQHQIREQEIIKEFEADIERINSRDMAEAEGLRRLNDYLRKCILELNQKVDSNGAMLKDMKAQLDETIKKNKELIKKNDVTLMQLETQLIEALQYADKVQELACAENIDKVHAPTVDKKGMIPRMQLKGLEENAVNTFHERAGNENDSKVVQVNNENVDLIF